MKKKISLLAAILVLAFSLAGCSSSSDSADYNKELLVQQADAMISNFSQMSEEDMETDTYAVRIQDGS